MVKNSAFMPFMIFMVRIMEEPSIPIPTPTPTPMESRAKPAKQRSRLSGEVNPPGAFPSYSYAYAYSYSNPIVNAW